MRAAPALEASERHQDLRRRGADRRAARDRQERAAGRRPSLRPRLIAVDLVSLLTGWLVGGVVGGPGASFRSASTWSLIGVGVCASVLAFAAAGLYRSPVNGMGSGAVGRLVRSMTVAALVALVLQASLDDVVPGLVVGSVAGAAAATVAGRYCFDVWLLGRRARGDFQTDVVVAGTAGGASALVDFLRLNPEAGFHATGIVGERPPPTDWPPDAVPWLGDIHQARDAVTHTGVSGVLLAVNELPGDTVSQLVASVSSAGIPIYVSTGLGGVSRARVEAFSLAHAPIALIRPARHSAAQRFAKRAIDLVAASLLLIVTAPVMAVAAALIKKHDGGPVLFRQVRIGWNGEPFTVVKLRTMEVGAEAGLADLRHHNERHGPLFKVSSDPRITPIGGLLRAAAIDELPQLFNVISGHMSMVGPRPALPAETAEFDDELLRRHVVRPGVTGLWQVEANHKASFEEYRRLDLFYVDNWSVAMDLVAMVGTIPALGRRALRALRRPAPSAPAPVGSPGPSPTPIEVGP